MSEANGDRFVRVAEKRVNSAIKTIRLIGNLSNRTNYSYTEKDVEAIFSALTKELKMCQERFKNSLPKQNNNFSLKK